MGFALMWAEGLAFALFFLALALRWAARGHVVRWLWPALVFVGFAGAVALTAAQFLGDSWENGKLIRTPWFAYALTWLAAFVAASAFLLWHGLRRPEPGLSRSAATWPRRRLWLGFAASILFFAFTFWNLDLSARAELAIARQEAGALLVAMTPPAAMESENAARIYAEANKHYSEALPPSLHEAARLGIDAKETVNWRDPSIVELVKKNETAIALLRKGAALPSCTFNHQRGLLDAASPSGPDMPRMGLAITLLAVDARVKATEGNLQRAFEDITAILQIFRHLSGYPDLGWGREATAWRTLEEVLRLAPPGKEPLPSFDVPELFPLVRKTREEHALLGMVLPAVASQPSLVMADERKKMGPVEALLIEYAMVPASRVLLVPDELPAMRKLFDDYHKSPRLARDETPKDWAELKQSVDNDRTSVFSILYIKPKQRKLLSDASALAALRQTARTGFAVAAYQRKHGKYPERLEQLAPDFLPATRTDPRDGQPLRMQRVADNVVIFAPQDSAVVETGKVHPLDAWRTPPIFRLPAGGGMK